MSNTTLTIGGQIDDSNVDVYEALESLTFTDDSSSIGTWSADLPLQSDFTDDLFEEVYLYSDGKLLFRGELESFETDYSSGLTMITGRGPLVRLNRDVISRTYNDTTAYDALVELWAETEFDALVSPPNSDIFDETYNVVAEHRSLWGYFGDPGSAIITDHVEPELNELVFQEPNILLDDSDSNGDQRTSIYLDEEVDRVWLQIETSEAVSWLRAGMRQHNGTIGSGTIEKVTQTNEYNTPQRVHIFEFEFTDEWDKYRPLVETGDYTVSITRSDVLVADQSDFAELEDVELDGTRLDVLKELHGLASYEFTISDYEDLDVRSFPKGTIAPEPDWTITSATRKRSFDDYANSVTVQGGRDGGSAPTASASDQDEIDLMDSMGIGDNGVIEAYEKDPELTTQSAVEDRANRFLDESIAERDEGGSLEIAPEFVPVGYSYNVSVYGDAFPYGGQIGNNSLYFDGASYFEWNWGGEIYDYQEGGFGQYLTLEAMVHPDLEALGDNQFRTVSYIETDGGNERFFVRVYGDGSVGLGTELSGDQFTRTGPGIVNNDVSQRLSVQWRNGGDERRVYVDGQHEATEWGSTTEFFLDEAVYYIGADHNGDDGFVGGIDDVRLWADDDFRSSEFLREHAYDDLVTEQVDFDQLAFYFRCNDRIGGLDNDGIAADVVATNHGAEYQDSFGQLEEVSYSLGSGETIDLDFDISGRVDTELIDTRRRSQSTQRTL